MHICENPTYLEDVRYVRELPLDWDRLRGTHVVITGATGMIGSFLTDVLMGDGLECTVTAIGRNAERAKQRFPLYWERENFRFLQADINQGLPEGIESADYLIHAASNTHPVAYATDPIGTIFTNTVGTSRVLELAAHTKAKRTVFLSSVEIYGENRGDCDSFSEDDCGYINCNTLRSGYPESKRVGEALCQAYIRQKGLDVVIPRLSRVYGPTVLSSDTKAISQFIHKGVRGEDIVLKSAGTQFYSYSYVADAVSGILFCLLNGTCGEAYNIAGDGSDIALRDLAAEIAELSGCRVVYEAPDAVEAAGYSKATRATLDNSRLKGLGWSSRYPMKQGLAHTLSILSQCGGCGEGN